MSVIAEQMQWLTEKAATGDYEWLVILTSRKKWKRYLQLTGYTMSFYYPHKEKPEEVLAQAGLELPPMLVPSSWEAGKYASFGHDGKDVPPVVTFIEDYVQKVMGLPIEEKAWKTKVTSFEDHLKKYG